MNPPQKHLPKVFSKKPTNRFRLSSSFPGGEQNPCSEVGSVPGRWVQSKLPAATDWPPPATTSSLHSIIEQVHRTTRHLDFLWEMPFANISRHYAVNISRFRSSLCHCPWRKKALKNTWTQLTCCSFTDRKSSESRSWVSYSSAGVLMVGSLSVCMCV